jgi:hypothetical protein
MVRVNTTMNDGPSGPSLDPEQVENDQPFAGCPCRQDESTAFVDGEISEWVPQPESDPGHKSKTESSNKSNPDEFNPDEFLDRARQLGKNLSSQFGEFITMVTHDTGQAKNSSAANSRGCLAPIPEEVPGVILPLPADEQTSVTMNTSMVSSNARRKKKKGTDKAPKARPKTIEAKSPAHDVSYSIPKSQSFDSDPLAEAVVVMPPHPKTRNCRDKIAVARRKPIVQPTVSQTDVQYEMPSYLPKVYALAEDKAQSVSSLSDSSNRGQGHHNDPTHRTMLT